jgi:hypothetical protein
LVPVADCHDFREDRQCRLLRGTRAQIQSHWCCESIKFFGAETRVEQSLASLGLRSSRSHRADEHSRGTQGDDERGVIELSAHDLIVGGFGGVA